MKEYLFTGWLVEWLFNATLTAEAISWRGRPNNTVAVGLDPKNSPSAGGPLNLLYREMSLCMILMQIGCPRLC